MTLSPVMCQHHISVLKNIRQEQKVTLNSKKKIHTKKSAKARIPLPKNALRSLHTKVLNTGEPRESPKTTFKTPHARTSAQISEIGIPGVGARHQYFKVFHMIIMCC